MSQVSLERYGIKRSHGKLRRFRVPKTRQLRLGWCGESVRHSLAARGISTSRREMRVCACDNNPHAKDAGYVAAARTGRNRSWCIIYKAKEQGIDDADGKYAVVCDGAILNTKTLKLAQSAMMNPDFVGN